METAAIMRMKELVQKLDRAAKAYYQQDTEIISNREYDQMYDELQALEKETGTVLANSPTVSVGYEAVDQLPKEEHESPMLSLDKTKDREVLREFIGEHKTLLSWKLDGLVISISFPSILCAAIIPSFTAVGHIGFLPVTSPAPYTFSTLV